LQEALIAFLIYRVSRTDVGGFRYDYATWLRTVVLVVAGAQQQPELLEVHVHIGPGGILKGPSNDTSAGPWTDKVHSMTVDSDWSCLSQDTFNNIQRYDRAG
jgi:hypothetical protein